MNILILTRSKLFECYGGDTTQVTLVKSLLEANSVVVHIYEYPNLPAQSRFYDVVHIYNVQNYSEALSQHKWAQKNRLPIVLTPVYWPTKYYISTGLILKYHHSPIFRFLCNTPSLVSAVVDSYRNFWLRRHSSIKECLTISNCISPNSIAELEGIIGDFSIPTLRSKAFISDNVISTAFDRHPHIDDIPELDASIRDHLNSLVLQKSQIVIQVARIEPLKNQLLTIKACQELGLPLILVGSFPNHRYLRECQHYASENIFFTGPLPLKSVFTLLSLSDIHCLPSFRESPGLSSLEAYSLGCSCVVSCYSPVQEYFQHDGFFVCDPFSLASLKNALSDAVLAHTKRKTSLSVADRFNFANYDLLRDQIFACYRFALSGFSNSAQ